MTIAIVGAAGVAGIALAQSITATGSDVVAISHSEQGTDRLREAGIPHVLRANLSDRSSLEAVFDGVGVVYAIPPALNPLEDEYLINAIRAAEAHGVGHFVYHSVMHPNTSFLRNHQRKLRVEEALQSSALPWTIVQPSMYAQVVLAMFGNQQSGTVGVPFDIDAEVSIVDLVDCAEVGKAIVTEPLEHRWATYELAGPIITMREAVSTVAAVRGIDLKAETIPAVRATLPKAAEGDPEAAADMISTFAHYNNHGFRGNGFVLTKLLGRPAASFEQVVSREVNV